MMLFALGLAHEELPCLAVVVSEALGAQTSLGTILDVREGREASFGRFAAVAGSLSVSLFAMANAANRHRSEIGIVSVSSMGSRRRTILQFKGLI
jgi:hypothetical protein